jgi:hypothetical protein
MPWHLSKSDPRKVYDSYHNTVGVMQTADQASLVVTAVNAFGPSDDMAIKLREPVARAGKESAEVTQSGGGSEHAKKAEPPPTHASTADGCCGVTIGRAMQSGALDGMTSFTCPKCGTLYEPKRQGPLINWEARAAVMVFKP